MYSIGEFSRITGLTVKTLRHYHDQGILVPSCIDDETGYRYYDDGRVELALVVTRLRRLEFPLREIADILAQGQEESDILEYLERRRVEITERLDHYRELARQLDQILSQEKEARSIMQATEFEVQEKNVDAMLIAGVRMQGRYQDCGQGFATLGRYFGRHACGKPLMLMYDSEYREDDADYEVCFPVKRGEDRKDIQVRELPSEHCVTLLHRGSYDQLRRSYARLWEYLNRKGYAAKLPTREVYLKGPGMIFRGNESKYLTEIQIPVTDKGAADTGSAPEQDNV